MVFKHKQNISFVKLLKQINDPNSSSIDENKLEYIRFSSSFLQKSEINIKQYVKKEIEKLIKVKQYNNNIIFLKQGH